MTINNLYVLLQDADDLVLKMKNILASSNSEKELTLADISVAKNVITDLSEFIKGFELE